MSRYTVATTDAHDYVIGVKVFIYKLMFINIIVSAVDNASGQRAL